MLDVIGAGATASSETNWHDVWQRSNEAAELQREVDKIRHDGFNSPPVVITRRSEFAAPWSFQVVELIKRSAQRTGGILHICLRNSCSISAEGEFLHIN